MGCEFGDLSVESHDQVFSNGFERSNVLDLGRNDAGQESSGQLSCPSSLMVVMRRHKRCRARSDARFGIRESRLIGVFEHLLQSR